MLLRIVLLLCPLWAACDKELTSVEKQPLVKYIIVVTDSATGEPLDSVEIRITTVFKDTGTFFTDDHDGRVELDEVESFWNRFSISRPGFKRLDFVDTVPDKRDTVFNRPVLRILEIKLVRQFGAEDGRTQVRIVLRDIFLNALTGGSVRFRDSLDVEQLLLDEDEDGVIDLGGLPGGRQFVLVEHPGHLGRHVEVNAGAAGDSAAIPRVTVPLQVLGSSISGQVFRKVPGQGNLPLGGARVVFRLSGDSLAFPQSFEAFTWSEGDSLGQYRLDSIPEADGRLEFFLDDRAAEPSLVLEVSKRQVALAGPLEPVLLEAAGQDGAAVLVQGPPDTVAAGDTLVFRLGLRVDTVKNVIVKEINAARGLLARHGLSGEGKILRIFLKDGRWQPGRKYEYSLDLRTSTGETFSIPGSGKSGIQGLFLVREDPEPERDILFPGSFALPYFSSGTLQSFHPRQDATSPRADSTTNMARLAWQWENKAEADTLDSLLVSFRDTDAHRQWTLWRAFAASGDSLPLFFSEIYSTAGFPDPGKPAFPPRQSTGDTLWLQILPKHGNVIFFARDTVLPPIVRGMGERVFTRYHLPDTLFIGPGTGSDSVRVAFHGSPGDSTPKGLDTAGVRVRPVLEGYAGNASDVELLWRWIDATGGWLIYVKKASGASLHGARLSVGLSEEPPRPRPLWHRNRFSSFVELRE